MDELLSAPDPACVAGYFPAADEDVVPAAGRGVDAEAAQGRYYGLRAHSTADYAVVEVLEVVVDRPASCDPAREQYAVLPEEVEVHLAVGVLVQAYDHRGPVAPEVEQRPFRPEFPKAVFVEGHVEVRIRRRV